MPALTTITIPTPEPYLKNDPTRNVENLAYVQLQIYAAAKAAGETVSLNPSAPDLTALIEALHALQYNGETIDLGDVSIILTGKATTIDNS